MKRQKRGNKGEVHVYRPSRSATYWIRYTTAGTRYRRNTAKDNEAEARIFAAQVARMVGLSNSDTLDEKRRLLDICRELIGEIPELESDAANLTATKDLPTVRDWFKREVDAMKQNGNGDDREVKAVSITRVSQVSDDFIAYLAAKPVNLADAPLNRIGPVDVAGFLGQYKTKGYSGASRKYALARIRAVFGHAVDKGLLPVNPASVKQVGRLKFDAGSIRQAFNEKQIGAVLGAVRQRSEPWVYLSAMLALFTGQRAGDIVAMRWEDVRDFDGALPTITVKQIKTGNTIVLPIADPLRRVLRETPPAQRQGHLLSEDIATAYAGRYRNLFHRPWRELLNAVDLAGMVDVPTLAKVDGHGTHGRTRYAWSFHSWRHTAATYLSGPDAHYVLGHRSEDEKRLGITAQYRHEDLRRLKKQLDVIPHTTPANVTTLTVAVNQ